MNADQNYRNQDQFEKIIQKLRDARDKLDVDLHLEGLSDLIENQELILKTCIFERIEFEFFYDLIYDYGSTLCYVRNEVLTFNSAIRWLSDTQHCEEREVFTNEIMNLIKFDEMKESELKQSFVYLDTYRLSNLLKDYLNNIQRKMISNHKIEFFESLFVDCFKV